MEKNTGKNTLMQDIMPRRKGENRDTAGSGSAKSGASGPVSGSLTVISGDTVFDGKIIAQGELRIDGTFKGEVTSSNLITVGTAGKLEATVEAKKMIVSGQVRGNLKIHERLELLSTGEIFGDLEIQPGALIIEQGARLEGRCSMGLQGQGKDEQKPNPQQPPVTTNPGQSGNPSR